MSDFMKKAAAFQRGGKIFLHASSKTTAGVWIMDEPLLVVDSPDATQLGSCVVIALNGSRENVPHPTIWKGHFDPMLRLVGVKTLNAFMKANKCVEIESAAGQISFTPTKNLGTTGGFEPLDTKVIQVMLGTPDSLGRSLFAAFDEAM